MAYLSETSGPLQWALEATEGAELIIGREAPAGIVLPLAPISRKHAAIHFRDGRHWLIDLSSRNGTFRNGEPVKSEPVRLIDGDEIVIGGAASLKFSDTTQTVKNERIGRLQGIWISEATGDVYTDGMRVAPPLSVAQHTLLSLVFKANGQVVTRDEIVLHVWPSDAPQGISEEAIDGLIKRLRARLRESSPQGDYIELVRGRGVRLRL
jgi:predicted component of type VI protein secretion system